MVYAATLSTPWPIVGQPDQIAMSAGYGIDHPYPYQVGGSPVLIRMTKKRPPFGERSSF